MLSVAGAVQDVLGYRPDQMEGESVFKFVHPTPADRVVEAFGTRSGGRHAEVRAIHRDGHEVLLSEVRVDEGSRVIRGVSVDVTELSATKAELRHRAQHDALTGLANRGLLADRLQRSADEPFALFVADLDRFKEINDTLGHPTGDRVLTVLADRFRADLPELELDRTLVAGLGVNEEDEILVETVVQLCTVLGHDVVAEGVETIEQAERLSELGCRRAQGYHFARPMRRRAMLDQLAATAAVVG